MRGLTRGLTVGCLVGLLLATAGGIVGPVDGAAAAGAPEEARPPDVTFVGDSLAVRSEDQVRAVFRHRRPMNVLAITDGAYVSWVRRRWLDTILRDPPSILVVALGHGDGTHSTPPDAFAAEVRAFLAAIVPHVDCVRWLDVRERWTYYRNVNRRAAAYNRMLRREAARFGTVEVVRYSAWADQADDSFFERDRLHPSPTGRWVFARMVRQAADGCDPNLRTGPYWDVLDHEAHAPAVRWLHRHGILREDHGNGTFAARLGDLPQPLTRGDLARWLWRREGRPTGAPPPPWSDVAPPLRPAAGWLADEGLVRGLADGSFRAERAVSRGELLRALWLLADTPPAGAPAPWSDIPARLADAAAWAWSNGVMAGSADGRFGPTAPVTLAAAARAVAPQDLPPPTPAPASSGPYPPPIRLYGDPPHGNWFGRHRPPVPTSVSPGGSIRSG